MTAAWSCLMAEGRSPEQKQWLGQTEFDMWPYRDRTVALLRKYARASVEVGRLPSLLGRECFRARVSSYPMASFEDIVIFVHDMDTALLRLSPFHQRLIAMNILEDYSLPEVAKLLTCPLRTVEREVPDALDVLSLAFIESGLIKQA
jgi:DNA-directed RNA polymerase specialized sigma24 family protein